MKNYTNTNSTNVTTDAQVSPHLLLHQHSGRQAGPLPAEPIIGGTWNGYGQAAERLLKQAMVHEEKKQFLTREIVGWLNGFEERPWWVLRKGKEVTDIWLAQRLRPYGIAPKNVWVDGKQGKGYEFKQCEEVLRRYIPRAEWEARKAELQEAREQREAAEKKRAEESKPSTPMNREQVDTNPHQ